MLFKSETYHVITKTASPIIWSTHRPRMYHTKSTQSCCGDPKLCSGLKEQKSEEMKTESKKPRKKVVVLGVTGQLGNAAALKGIEKGYEVYGTSRRTVGLKKTSRFIPIETPKEELTSRVFWKEKVFEEVICSETEEITVINTIGGAHPPEGQTLFDLNVGAPVAAAQGLDLALQGKKTKVRFVQCSSIAASLLDDEYGESKRTADRELAKYTPAFTSLRVGYAFNELKMSEFSVKYIDMEHAWGPEQMAGLPVQILFEHGDHPIQPVFVGDLVHGAYNAPFAEGAYIVDAVGEEVLTTDGFFKFFTDLSGKPYRPIYISYKVAREMAKHFPHGHFAPYAIEYCERMDKGGKPLCALPFTQLLERPTTRMEEVYKPQEGEKFVFAAPPLAKHTQVVAQKVMQQPGAIIPLAKGATSIAGSIIAQTAGRAITYVVNMFFGESK